MQWCCITYHLHSIQKRLQRWSSGLLWSFGWITPACVCFSPRWWDGVTTCSPRGFRSDCRREVQHLSVRRDRQRRQRSILRSGLLQRTEWGSFTFLFLSIVWARRTCRRGMGRHVACIRLLLYVFSEPASGPNMSVLVHKSRRILIQWDELPVARQKGFITNYTVYLQTLDGSSTELRRELSCLVSMHTPPTPTPKTPNPMPCSGHVGHVWLTGNEWGALMIIDSSFKSFKIFQLRWLAIFLLSYVSENWIYLNIYLHYIYIYTHIHIYL